MTRRGRPPKHSDEQIAKLVAKFRTYIEHTELPIIAEFAYQNEISKQTMYEKDEFATLIKMATAKKEAALERKTLSGEYNATMAVFSLKQLGWRDKQELEHSGGIQIAIEGEVKEWAK